MMKLHEQTISRIFDLYPHEDTGIPLFRLAKNTNTIYILRTCCALPSLGFVIGKKGINGIPANCASRGSIKKSWNVL